MLDDYNKIYKGYKKILFVGSYPPPLGGVSVHIYRLIELLKKDGLKSSIFNTFRALIHRRIKSFVLFLRIILGNYEIVHLHNSKVKVFEVILLAKRFKSFKLYFTDHNPRLFEGLSSKEIVLVKRFLSTCDLLIAVSAQIVENYKKEGVSHQNNQIVLNAFLPPPINDEERILKTYPESLLSIMHNRHPLITSNAYQLNFQNEVDLYGLDLCIEATKRLKPLYHDILFVFAIANEQYNADYLAKMRTLVFENNLENNFIFLTGQKELWPIIKRSDLFLRPTNTDGDAISIREALFFKVSVIASDVCKRAEGVITFNNRDIDDLFSKLMTHFNSNKNINHD